MTPKYTKKSSKFKERKDNGKKNHKKNSSLYCSLHGENKGHTSRECNVVKIRTKDKDNPLKKKKDHKKKFKSIILLQAESAHQRTKYKKLNKDFAKKKTSKEETIILDDTLERNSSSISEADNSPDEYEKTSIAYYADISSRSIGSEEKN